ncbi:MAG TPA: class I SAM-dependent methyltransferase [Kofleriaceae bacterium]
MDDDVPSGIDLRDPNDAAVWAREADVKRPWRAEMRAAIADRVHAAGARRVLELGSGPGLLAEAVLSTCSVDEYVLFDFSPPMLDMSRTRVGAREAARFVLGDFKQPRWTEALHGPFDAVVTMQAVHEIRHKRHVPGLYRELRALVAGVLLVSDHDPPDDSARFTALHSTQAEQHAALASAGFVDVRTELVLHGLYLIVAR